MYRLWYTSLCYSSFNRAIALNLPAWLRLKADALSPYCLSCSSHLCFDKTKTENKNSGGLSFGTPHYGISSSFPGGCRGHCLLDWYERSIKNRSSRTLVFVKKLTIIALGSIRRLQPYISMGSKSPFLVLKTAYLATNPVLPYTKVCGLLKGFL